MLEPNLAVSVKTLVNSLHTDHSYAWSWHCNIAISMIDEGASHEVANRGAARFLYVLTTSPETKGLDVTQFPEFKQLEIQWKEEKASNSSLLPILPAGITRICKDTETENCKE